MTRRVPLLLIVVIGCLLIVTLYFFIDPSTSVWMPKCMFHTLTGLDCPGCGTQRALHSLFHGDIEGLVRANAMLLFFIPLLLFLGFVEIFKGRMPHVYNTVCKPFFIISVLVIILAWGVVRNL